jgi:hypothetical protein
MKTPGGGIPTPMAPPGWPAAQVDSSTNSLLGNEGHALYWVSIGWDLRTGGQAWSTKWILVPRDYHRISLIPGPAGQPAMPTIINERIGMTDVVQVGGVQCALVNGEGQKVTRNAFFPATSAMQGANAGTLASLAAAANLSGGSWVNVTGGGTFSAVSVYAVGAQAQPASSNMLLAIVGGVVVVGGGAAAALA